MNFLLYLYIFAVTVRVPVRALFCQSQSVVCKVNNNCTPIHVYLHVDQGDRKNDCFLPCLARTSTRTDMACPGARLSVIKPRVLVPIWRAMVHVSGVIKPG